MPMPAPSSCRAYIDFAMGRLLPLVRDRFADPQGGFHESLDASGRPQSGTGRRLMVQCRLLYVLAQAAVLGDRSGEAAAAAGFAFLRDTYQDRRHGGWFFRIGAPAAEEADQAKDFYAHAFVLFALAWLHRAFATPGALDLAAETYATMCEKLAVPSGPSTGGLPRGGLWDAASRDWQPASGLRSQNPHMHLLEALHALHEATGEAFWLREAQAIVDLFRARFFDAGTATLGEFFAPDWSPHPQQGHIVEPGHHFEWVWLLHRHAALTGQPLDPAEEALFATAWRHGFDAEHGGLHDRIDCAGRPLARTRRIWPVTEAIKACLARREAGLPLPPGEPARLIGQLLDGFIRPAELGWLERLTREGAASQTTLPGSTPYHLFLAAAELQRGMPDSAA
jgi:mannose-6-phosphate isomerase